MLNKTFIMKTLINRFKRTFCVGHIRHDGFPKVIEISASKNPIPSQAKNPAFLSPINETFCPIDGRGKIHIKWLGKINHAPITF